MQKKTHILSAQDKGVCERWVVQNSLQKPGYKRFFWETRDKIPHFPGFAGK